MLLKELKKRFNLLNSMNKIHFLLISLFYFFVIILAPNIRSFLIPLIILYVLLIFIILLYPGKFKLIISSLIVLFFLFTYMFFAASNSRNKVFIKDTSPADEHLDYYSRLTKSLIEGKFYLTTIKPSAELLKLSNPYDFDLIAKNNITPRYLDVSLYNGKYYLYFGITPSLVLMVPFRMLTGYFINEGLATGFFSCIAFLFLVLLVLFLYKLYFQDISDHFWYLTIICLGSGTYILGILRSPVTYELAIVSGLCFTTGAIFFLVFSFFVKKKWINLLLYALSGLFFAFTVGCKPFYILSSALIIPILLKKMDYKISNFKAIVLPLLFFSVPYILYGSFLAYYNYSRFGSVFEFGFIYQVNNSDNIHMGPNLGNDISGVLAYLFNMPKIEGRFPYFFLTNPDYVKTIYTRGFEPMVGIFAANPYLLFLVLFPFYKEKFREKYKTTIILFFLFVGLIYLFINASCGIIFRYEVDFSWFFVVSSLMIFYTMYKNTKNASTKTAFNIILTLLVIFSFFVNFNTSLTGRLRKIKILAPLKSDNPVE